MTGLLIYYINIKRINKATPPERFTLGSVIGESVSHVSYIVIHRSKYEHVFFYLW